MKQDLELTTLDQITAEIVLLKQQTAMNIIEIGKRLLQAKEQLPHGQWGAWLQEQVEFSHATANRFMQIATEYSANSSALRNLNPTKVYALLELPGQEREDFIQAEHLVPSGEIKTVDEMTTRELQQAIKARNAAQAEMERLQSQATKLQAERDRIKQDKAQLEQSAKQMEEELLDLREAAQQLVILEPAIVERVPAEVERELAQLRAQVGQPGSEITARYRVQFETLTTVYNSLLCTLEGIKTIDADTYARYRAATAGLITKMQATLPE